MDIPYSLLQAFGKEVLLTDRSASVMSCSPWAIMWTKFMITKPVPTSKYHWSKVDSLSRSKGYFYCGTLKCNWNAWNKYIGTHLTVWKIIARRYSIHKSTPWDFIFLSRLPTKLTSTKTFISALSSSLPRLTYSSIPAASTTIKDEPVCGGNEYLCDELIKLHRDSILVLQTQYSCREDIGESRASLQIPWTRCPGVSKPPRLIFPGLYLLPLSSTASIICGHIRFATLEVSFMISTV